MQQVTLPTLPIVGNLRLSSQDGESLYSIEVVHEKGSKQLEPFFENCFNEFKAFLTGETKTLNIKLDFSSVTPFQKKVLKEMIKIPYGKTASYKDIALKLNSRAYQAIGSACGKNPFLLIYPCHRVVGTTNPGGFAHGPEMKLKLVNL
jgi:O-6-methylguanine DNA methyltransferase